MNCHILLISGLYDRGEPTCNEWHAKERVFCPFEVIPSKFSQGEEVVDPEPQIMYPANIIIEFS